jgi:hypothetical protein
MKESFLNRGPRPLAMWVSLIGLAYEMPLRHVIQLGLDIANIQVKAGALDGAALATALGTLGILGGYRSFEKLNNLNQQKEN